MCSVCTTFQNAFLNIWFVQILTPQKIENEVLNDFKKSKFILLKKLKMKFKMISEKNCKSRITIMQRKYA